MTKYKEEGKRDKDAMAAKAGEDKAESQEAEAGVGADGDGEEQISEDKTEHISIQTLALKIVLKILLQVSLGPLIHGTPACTTVILVK